MAKIQRFEDMAVWKEAVILFEDIYEISSAERFRREFSIRDQLIRAALSITNNIAEGFEYDNRKDFIKFLRYSKGSTGEVRNLLNILAKIKLINKDQHKILSERAIGLSKQLYGFIKYLQNRNKD